ncbi:extracellular solute-binding protein [Paenibacillus sp. strain BS8-2]
MQNKKKWVAAGLATMLAASLTAGCGNNEDNAGESSTSQLPDATANEGSAESLWSVPIEGDKYSETVKISQLKVTPADVTYQPGENENDNHFTKWLSKTFNIEISYPWTTTQKETFDSKLSLMLASGEKMPDIVMANGDIVNDLIDSGKFLEVGSLFDKYASDTWKQAVEQSPNAWLPYTREDGRYALPILIEAHQNDDVLWIRQDWLDKLGLQAPTTLDEMEKVMDAFANQDPDGNGQKDTIGLTIGLKDGYVSYMSDTNPLFGANGVMPKQWNVASDGTLQYGSVQPGARETLEMLARWYKNGYLPKEAAVYDINKASELAVQGKAGMIFGGHWLAEWPLGDTVKNDPNANFQPIQVPAGAEGMRGFRENPMVTGAILISKGSKHPDAFFLYQNWMYDRFPTYQAPFDQPIPKGNYFDINEGEIKEGAYANMDKLSMTTNGARIPNLRMEYYAALNAGESPTNTLMEQLSLKPDGNKLAAQVILDSKSFGMPEMFQGTPTKTMKEQLAFLDKMELETYTKIIYGQAPISDFDTFVSKWKSAGGDKITEEVNEWYKQVAGN